MSATAHLDPKGPSRLSARCEHILDAAETCFVRAGFHRTTIQDIAREAAMSQGNIYRYFTSKEAVVLGIASRWGDRAAGLVERLPDKGDQRAVLLAVIEEYFLKVPRAHAVLRLEIWSEAARNPVIAAMVRGQELTLRAWLTQTLGDLATARDCDVDSLCDVVTGLMRSALISHAMTEGFDAGPMTAQFSAILNAGLEGRCIRFGGAALGRTDDVHV